MTINYNLIYDIGMHKGEDTEYYLHKGFDVIAIEASPILFVEGKKKFSFFVDSEKLKILNVGISDIEGKMDFFLNKENSVWNSFDINIAQRKNAEIEIVHIRTSEITSIIKEFGVPYYMKIDIEGNDILCLKSLEQIQVKPKYISAEVNSFEIIQQMYKLGYSKFKLIDQFSLLPLEIPPIPAYASFMLDKNFRLSKNILIKVIRKSLGPIITQCLLKKQRKLLNYPFQFGSSGAFGEQLPGQWLNFEEVTEVYNYYLSEHKRSGRDAGFNFWVDIHGEYEK